MKKQSTSTSSIHPILYSKINISRSKYSERDQSGVLANWIGMLILIFAIFVYLSTNPQFKRMSKPDDDEISMSKPEKFCWFLNFFVSFYYIHHDWNCGIYNIIQMVRGTCILLSIYVHIREILNIILCEIPVIHTVGPCIVCILKPDITKW